MPGVNRSALRNGTNVLLFLALLVDLYDMEVAIPGFGLDRNGMTRTDIYISFFCLSLGRMDGREEFQSVYTRVYLTSF